MASPKHKPRLTTIVAVALGGVIGAVARVYLPWPSLTSVADLSDPLPTVLVNLSGAIFLGLIAGYTTQRAWPDPLQKGLAVGLLGSFTTMSGLALAISLRVMGYPPFSAGVSLDTIWRAVTVFLALAVLLGVTTWCTLMSYRIGIRMGRR